MRSAPIFPLEFGLTDNNHPSYQHLFEIDKSQINFYYKLSFSDNRSRSLTPLPKMIPNHTEVIDFPVNNQNGPNNDFEMVTMLHSNSKNDGIETIVTVNH